MRNDEVLRSSVDAPSLPATYSNAASLLAKPVPQHFSWHAHGRGTSLTDVDVGQHGVCRCYRLDKVDFTAISIISGALVRSISGGSEVHVCVGGGVDRGIAKGQLWMQGLLPRCVIGSAAMRCHAVGHETGRAHHSTEACTIATAAGPPSLAVSQCWITFRSETLYLRFSWYAVQY